MPGTRARESSVLAGRPRLAGAGVAVFLALFILAASALILRGQGLLAVAAFAVAALYAATLTHWQRGVYGLLAYLPFGGAVTLALYPWRGLAFLNPVLYKDWLFVVPAYLGFVSSMVLRGERGPRLKRLPTALLIAFSVLVLAQMANPNVPNLLAGLIGAKVWLLYLPLYVLTFVLVASRRHLIFLLRFLAALAVIPCVVGIVEYVSAQFLGYQTVMAAIYGAAGAQATQEYTAFEVGRGWITRIPSTFTFVTQYFGFTLAMLVACYAVWRTDPSARWRRFGCWMLGVAAVACFLCGARAAFVFVPLLLMLMFELDRGISGVLRAGLYIGGVLASTLAVSRMAAVVLFQQLSELFRNYALHTAYGDLVQAVLMAPLGNGTGTNTGSARYAFERPELFTTIENYYAKVVYELGVVGLLLFWGLFGVILWQAFRERRQLRDPGLRACSAALLAFVITMALNSFKGWLLDLDPINVYFWMFAGVLAKLPYLEARPGALAGRSPEEAP